MKKQIFGSCATIEKIVKENLEDGLIKELPIPEQDELIEKAKSIIEGLHFDKGQLHGNYDFLESRKFIENANSDDEDTVKPYYIVCISGGANGFGDWQDYFSQLSVVFGELKESFYPWLIQIDNDVTDDIHYVYIGLREAK